MDEVTSHAPAEETAPPDMKFEDITRRYDEQTRRLVMPPPVGVAMTPEEVAAKYPDGVEAHLRKLAARPLATDAAAAELFARVAQRNSSQGDFTLERVASSGPGYDPESAAFGPPRALDGRPLSEVAGLLRPQPRRGLFARLGRWMHDHITGPIQGAVRGILVPAELFRALWLALGGASGIAVMIAVLTAILHDVPAIFTNAAVAGLVAHILIFTIDLLRRSQQGQYPASAVVVSGPPLEQAEGDAYGPEHFHPPQMTVPLPPLRPAPPAEAGGR